MTVSDFSIRPLLADDVALTEAAARLLVAAFAEHWPDAWPTLEEAEETVRDVTAPEAIALAAVDASGHLLGWIGGLDEGYSARRVWELHPLAVDEHERKRGVGRALVAALEVAVLERGGAIIRVGTDDDDNMTSAGGIDLWHEPWRHLRDLQNLHDHPFGFYQRLGYTVVGFLPDADGEGKPDIFMAKKLR